MVSQRQVASRREDSGFTRAELVFVLIVMAGVLYVLYSALFGHKVGGAAHSPRKSACRGNMHFVGFGLSEWCSDHDEAWPRFYMPEDTFGANVNVFGRLYAEGYVDDPDRFACPDQPIRPRLAPGWSGLGPRGDSVPSVIDSAYAYDNARIPPNADPARIVMGDTLEKVRWPATGAFSNSGDAPPGKLCPPNHAHGANVLFVDMAVRYLPPDEKKYFWVPYQGVSERPVDAAGGRTGYEQWAWGQPWGEYPLVSGARKYDFVRAGTIPNPRLTGSAGVGADAASGNDTEVAPDSVVAMATDVDVFAIDAETPNQFALLGEWQFRTGWMRLDASNKENDDPASGALRVAMSKTDCAMQPGLGFRAGTGWPDSIYRVGGQTPATPREKWTPTEGIALAVPPRKPTSPWSPHAVWLCVGAVLTVLVVVAAALIRRRRVPPTG